MTTPDPTWQRARELAHAQCTDNEIAAGMARAIVGSDANDVDVFAKAKADALSWVEAHADLVDEWRAEGRAEARVAFRDHAMEHSKDAVRAKELWGRQHLGYTSEGVDMKVRKVVEQAERQRGGKLKVAG